MKPIPSSEDAAGFSLLELLLALGLGLVLSGLMLQALIDEGQNGQRLARLLRERAVQRRALALVKAEVALATAVSATPQLEAHACSLAGRQPVLHLSTAAGAITYSVGAAPSAIWRGQVLMRCGPAYGLHGQLSAAGPPQNRVVIDGLAAAPDPWLRCGDLLPQSDVPPVELGGATRLGLAACLSPAGRLLALRLVQDLSAGPGREPQRVVSSTLVGGP
ncbi:prepilin-type cleavage/methylation domain-containing protein [Vulcanococcus sp.]|uniref:prepilin-type cleavage/methylation domain-containing protein n=1 Tax=Vulcanococcus sp. TaxID=2856995 RepID=UPI0037D9D57A